MMKYIPVASEAEAKSISALIYDLTRPSGATNDSTQYLFDWRVAANGDCYLCVGLDWTLPVHADRGPAIEAAVLGLRDAGKILPASASTLLATIAANSGKTVTLGQVIPPEWLAVALDEIPLAQNSPV